MGNFRSQRSEQRIRKRLTPELKFLSEDLLCGIKLKLLLIVIIILFERSITKNMLRNDTMLLLKENDVQIYYYTMLFRGCTITYHNPGE